MKFPGDIPSSPSDNLKEQYVLVFDLNSFHDASQNYLYPELVGGPLSLELKFNFLLEPVTQLIVLEQRRSSVAVDKIDFLKKTKMDNVPIR